MTYLAQAANIPDAVSILHSQSAVVRNAQLLLSEYDFPDIIFGGLMMILILFIHGFSMALLNRYYLWKTGHLLEKKRYWTVEGVFYLIMVCIMLTHIMEIGIWS